MRLLVLLALTTVSFPETPAPPLAPDDGLAAVPVRVDVNHSNLTFSVRHLGFTRIRGAFNDWSATIMWNEADPTSSTVAVVVKTASVDTRHERRDADLRSDDFFGSEQYPAIVLRSTSVDATDDGYLLHADLTVRGVTRAVVIPFHYQGPRDTPRGPRLFAVGAFTIKRSDYDLARENRLARSLGVVSDNVELEFDLQGVVADPAEARFSGRGRPSIGGVMEEIVGSQGMEAALRRYEDLRAQSPGEYNFRDRELLTLGYRLHGAGRTDAAAALAEYMANTAPHADWHVLGATLAVDRGEREAALEHLAKALALDAFHPTALAMGQLLSARPSRGTGR